MVGEEKGMTEAPCCLPGTTPHTGARVLKPNLWLNIRFFLSTVPQLLDGNPAAGSVILCDGATFWLLGLLGLHVSSRDKLISKVLCRHLVFHSGTANLDN